MSQRWESLLFLHWEADPEMIQATLPPGLSVDTFRERAYVGIVPFFMRHIRPVGCPALPWISYFQELNVRTYVYDENGIPGIWFYSLDCNQPLAVWLAQAWFHLPYIHAIMAATRSDWVAYHSHRMGTDMTASYQYRGQGQEVEAELASLEFFLLERYYLYAYQASHQKLIRGQVSHLPYRYCQAEVQQYSLLPAHYDGLLALSGSPIQQCLEHFK
jgi:uncharacterized protein YqjF (DUF2071 family)